MFTYQRIVIYEGNVCCFRAAIAAALIVVLRQIQAAAAAQRCLLHILNGTALVIGAVL